MLLKLVLNLCTQAILQSYTPELLGLHRHSAMPSLQHNSYLGIWCQTVYGIHSLKQSCTLNPLKSDRWYECPIWPCVLVASCTWNCPACLWRGSCSLHFPHVTPTHRCGQSACFHSCHTLMAPCCKQQNINAGAWSIWPYMPQSLALYWIILVLLQKATPQKRLPESSNLRLGSIPLSALFPLFSHHYGRSGTQQWLLFALAGNLLNNPIKTYFSAESLGWSLEWHW